MTIPNFSGSESEGGAQLQVEQVQADRTAADPATVLGPQGWPGDSASYQLLFEDAPVGYMVLNRSGQIMRANHAAGAMLGLASGQLEGQQLTHWLHWQQHGQLEALLGTLEGRLLQGGKSAEFKLLRADGQSCYAQVELVVSHNVQEAGPGGSQLLMALSDITALKKAQRDLVHLNQTLESRIEQRTADALSMASEMERFMQSVAHDLATPLRHILSFAGRLETADLNEQSRRSVATIVASARRMETLISALDQLALACNSQLSLTAIDLDRVLDAALKESGNAPGLTLHREDLPRVICDTQSMQTVLRQLLENAFKATDGRPHPTLRIWAEQVGAEIVIYLRDNGRGFNPNYRESMFEVFRKLHPERDFPGEGVGLAVVRRLMLRQGGRIWAESAGQDQGASFTLVLPAAP